MTSNPRRVPGYALIVAAVGITSLMFVWLLTSGAQSGGIVLGLLMTFFLAGPLAAAGWYVLSRERVEQVEEQAFAGKRRILEADRLFRVELAARLEALAGTPGLPGDKLRQLSAGVRRNITDETAWYDAVHLDDARAGMLAEYDDLVWEQVRSLADHPHLNTEQLDGAVNDLRQAIDRRNDLLIRGRPAAAIAPSRLLRAAEAECAPSTFRDLEVGDAVSRGHSNYIVDRVLTGFADGETWKLAHMAASGPDDDSETWLSIAPGGLELAWLKSVPPPRPEAPSLTTDGVNLSLEGSGDSLVRVQTSVGSAPGELVHMWRYRHGERIGLVQQWPDASIFAYSGTTVQPSELEVWPATRAVGSAPS